jgi:hypothetical protein
MTCSIRVVLPLPDQPAKPNTRVPFFSTRPFYRRAQDMPPHAAVDTTVARR